MFLDDLCDTRQPVHDPLATRVVILVGIRHKETVALVALLLVVRGHARCLLARPQLLNIANQELARRARGGRQHKAVSIHFLGANILAPRLGCCKRVERLPLRHEVVLAGGRASIGSDLGALERILIYNGVIALRTTPDIDGDVLGLLD